MASDPDHVKEAAKEAAAVKAIELAAACAMILIGVVMQLAQRQASEPDFVPTLRLRLARQSERGWARLAAWSWRRAERFRLEYEALSHGD